MPIFEVQGPDGKTYEVDAPSLEEASKAFQPAPGVGVPTDTGDMQPLAPEQAAEQEGVRNEMRVQNEYEAKPWYTRAGIFTDDLQRLFAEGVTAGGADYLLGPES